MLGILEIHTTVATRDQALLLARKLVSEHLAACMQIVPGVYSVFNWEGRIQEEEECLLILKTTEEAWPALRDRLEQLHPYDTPEIIALEVKKGSFSYLNWVRECTTK
jgi:periplasmic divalent cation tolerance protein